jgi:poly-gamma-glutamate capsule biosynthesis protein CapA/YwtB (metallophosphatase superfamily)
MAMAIACSDQPPRGPRAELWIAGDVHLGATGILAIPASVGGAAGIINLEGGIGSGAASSSSARLVNDPSALPALAGAGVRVAGIANNHTRDLGATGPAETARQLARWGIAPAGDIAGAALVSAGTLKVVVTAHDLSAGVPAGLAEELAEVRLRGDALVSTFHVAGPPSYIPKPDLRAAVDTALAAGARVVAAHGTHALGPVERRGGAVVAWGLGNLAFACDCSREPEGAILRVTIPGDGEVEATIIPIDAGLAGTPPRLAADPALALDLLDAIGSSPLSRQGNRARF